MHQGRLLMVTETLCSPYKSVHSSSATKLSCFFYIATMASTVTGTPLSVWGRPRLPTKAWSCVWMARRTSSSLQGDPHSPPIACFLPTSTLQVCHLRVAGTARSPVTSARVGSHPSWRSPRLSGLAALSQAHVRQTALQFPSHTLTHRLVDTSFVQSLLPMLGFSFVKQSCPFVLPTAKYSSKRSWCWSWCVLGRLSLSWWLLFRPSLRSGGQHTTTGELATAEQCYW